MLGIKKHILIMLAVSMVFACTKEPVTHKTIVTGNNNNGNVYEINDVTVEQKGINKTNQKNINEYATIAYSDIYNKSISQFEIDKIARAYSSFGDKTLIEDLLIRNFLSSSSISIPTKTEMNVDVSNFVTETYKKLLNREPNEFEKWYLVDYIQKDTAVTPELVYYSFLTSNEYRHY